MQIEANQTLDTVMGFRHVCPPPVKLHVTLIVSAAQPRFGSIQYVPVKEQQQKRKPGLAIKKIRSLCTEIPKQFKCLLTIVHPLFTVEEVSADPCRVVTGSKGVLQTLDESAEMLQGFEDPCTLVQMGQVYALTMDRNIGMAFTCNFHSIF